MGNKFEAVTDDINQHASVRIARSWRPSAGVKNFVFASSCSMYGYAEGGARKESDPTNPLTAYARSKIGSEKAFAELDRKRHADHLAPLRHRLRHVRPPAARSGAERLRRLRHHVGRDHGSQRRHALAPADRRRGHGARNSVGDSSASAENGGELLAVNAGRDESNYQVRDLAEAVARQVPGTTVSINTNAPPDKRSYQGGLLAVPVAGAGLHPAGVAGSVDHAPARRACRPWASPTRISATSPYMRLKTLERHMAAGRLGADLRWRFRSHASGTERP